MDILEFFKIKHIIETKNTGCFKWRVERRVIEDCKDKYCIAIDNGDQAYHKFFMSKYEYEPEEMVYICNKLAEALGIECRVYNR